jgi:hypothetical protein
MVELLFYQHIHLDLSSVLSAMQNGPCFDKKFQLKVKDVKFCIFVKKWFLYEEEKGGNG